jgi:putative DNA primase/helicase
MTDDLDRLDRIHLDEEDIPVNGEIPTDGEQPHTDTSSGTSGPVIYPAPTAPYAVAKRLYEGLRDADGVRNLLAYRGGWQLWRTTHWSEIDLAEVRANVYKALENACYVKAKDGVPSLEPWDPTRHKIGNVLEAMAAVGHLSSEIDAPEWIERHDVRTTAAQVISCENGLLNLEARSLHQHTPALFNLVHVPFAYTPDAPDPVVWLDFLASLWGDDEDAIALLQEYFGYVLSGRLDMQKLLMLVGPTRSGKGTIARTLRALVGGRRNVPGPTLASMATNFGLSPLIGKPLAIISDARLGSLGATVVERLLSITGEDTLTIDRKYREPWTGKLLTRFVILTNEVPEFQDASGVIANRFLVLNMTETWLGREDHELTRKLRPELALILNWSLAGLDRLNEHGRFTVPPASDETVIQMQDLASPVSAFVRERCTLEPAAEIAVDKLYAAWRDWAERNGHKLSSKVTFGRDLRAVAPRVRITQPRIDGKQVYHYLGVRLGSQL